MQYKRCEIVLHSTKEYANPFADVDIDAVFTHEDGTVIKLPGFWNGDNEWKVRFSPEKTGLWKYEVTCTDKDNASLCASGEIEATESEKKTELEKHGYVRLEEGKPYMVYGDGTPFFWLGDTHWQMADWERLHECNYPGCNCGNQFKHLADDRIKKGFNVYQTYFDSAESDGGGNKRVHHWWTEKFTKINPQAFNETMDVMIEYLANNGMTVAMGFGVHCSTPIGFKFNVEPLLRFTRYCIARYACYPTVWITAQEIDNLYGSTFEMWKQVGALVNEIDGYHRPNGAHIHAHPASDPRSQDLNEQPWHQWWTLQKGHGDVNRLIHRFFYRDYANMPKNKLYIETECNYDELRCMPGECSSDSSRMGAYIAVQSGSAGFTYGAVGVWALRWSHTEETGWTGYSPEPWYAGMNKHGSDEMTYLKKFYEHVKWWTLEPSFGYEFAMLEARNRAAISHRGQDTVIYYFYDADIEVGMMSNLKKNTVYNMRYYDTIHGKFIELPSFSTPDGTYPIPKKPSRRDWLLLVTTEDLGEYETEVYPQNPPTIAPTQAKLGKEIPVKAIWTSLDTAEYPAENMTDGRDDTYWRSFAPVTGQTITMDFGEVKKVGFVGMISNMPKAQMVDFRIYGSRDGKDYTFLTERVGKRVGIGGPYKEFYDPIDTESRFIKVFFNARTDGDNLQFVKFGAYEKQE